MQDGSFQNLPAAELRSFREGIDIQAEMEGLTARFAVTENADGTVSIAWFVSPKAELPVAERLGGLSRRFEVGAGGPGTISSGQGDRGGKSYGAWQMTSLPAGGTVTRFVTERDFPFAPDFAGLVPGSADFDTVWKKLAKADPDGFETLQYGFILRTHYDVAARLLRARGFDAAARAHAVQDVLWSTAVQHGPDGAAAITASAARIAGDDDAALIRAIYAERGRRDGAGTLVHFASNSRVVQESVARRFATEQRDALAMLAQRPAKPLTPPPPDATELPPWFIVAKKELGQAEAPGAADNARIRAYFAFTSLGEQPDSVPWCGAFVAFCLGSTGFVREGSGSARAADWLKFGLALDAPRPGCIVVLEPQAPGASGHVAFLDRIEGERIFLLGGNQADRVGLDAFKLRDVRRFGFRWPSGA